MSIRAVLCGSDAVLDVVLPAISSHPCHTLMLFQYLLFIFTYLVGSSLYCHVNCVCKKNCKIPSKWFHPWKSMHPWKLHLLLLFLLFLFLVFDGLVRGRMRCIRSHLSCSHKEGSKYLTLLVIVIRRRSLPSSPLYDMMHHVLLVLVLSTCPCWLSLVDSSTCGPRASLLVC